MTRTEIRVLECLCRLEVCSHVKDRILVEPLSKNVVSVSDISAVNLIVGWKLFAFGKNSSISFLLVSYTDMTSSINLFQKKRFNAALSENFCFYFGHEDVSKGYGHFRACTNFRACTFSCLY